MIRASKSLFLLAGFATMVVAQVASAAEVTRVLSARSIRDIDVDFSAAWYRDQRTSSVKREFVDPAAVLLLQDAIAHHRRDSLQLRADVGIVHDVSLFMAASIVLADSRTLEFDRGGDCAATRCVDTLVRDHILPGDQTSSWGLDAESGKPYTGSSNQLFRGPDRHGFEYLALGARWAAFNQARDRTKPTWIVGLETRLSVGADQRFDPGKPTGNRGVGAGYHQLILSTVFSRQFGDWEPSMGAWFMEPMLTSNSVFKNQGDASAQQRLGGQLGLESTLWSNPTWHGRFGIEATGYLEYRFAGLAQSELWEVLAGDSRCSASATSYCRSGIDVGKNGVGYAPNSGALRTPGYGVAGFDAGFSALAAGHARLRGLVGMMFDESHFLSDATSGNHLYDTPGRRFKVEGIYTWRLLLDLMATF